MLETRRNIIARAYSTFFVVVVIVATAEARLGAANYYKPLPIAKSVADGLRYTEMERTILGDVRDSTNTQRITDYRDKAMFVLLRRVAALPEPTAKELDDLDRPSYRNMLSRPKRYRGEAVRYVLRVCLVRKLTPEGGLGYSRWFPRDRAIWQVDCIDGTGKYPGDRPLRLFATFDPTTILGRGTKTPDGISYGQAGRKVEIAAVFFRVFSAETRRSTEENPEWKNYPLLVCWYMAPSRASSNPVSANPIAAMMLVGIVLLAGVFVYFKKKVRRPTGVKAEYRPLRQENQSSDDAETPPAAADTDDAEDVEVDPALRAAAEQYRQEHPDEYEERPG